MADILAALSDHVSHAPLSQAQTISVCKYLYDQTKEAQKQIQELRGSVSRNTEEISFTNTNLMHTDGKVRSLEQDMSSASALMAAASEQVGINSERTKRNQESCNAAQEGVEQLRSGLKVLSMNTQIIRDDHKSLREDTGKLRKDLDTKFRSELNTVAEKLQMAVLRVDRLHIDLENAQTSLRDQRDRLRQSDTEANNVREVVSKLNTVAAEHAEALASASLRADNAKDNLEMTNAVVLKVHQELESTRIELSSLRGDHRSLYSWHDALKQDHLRAAKEASDATTALERSFATQGHQGEMLQKVSEKFAALQSGVEQTGTVIKALEGKVDRLHILATSTQENLQVTNAFVLPNLSTSDSIAPGFGGSTYGGSTVAASTTHASTKSPKSLQRKRREAKWMERNIGIVPDRMAWL